MKALLNIKTSILFLSLTFSLSISACNSNKSNDPATDSIDSASEAQVDSIDSTFSTKADTIDSTSEALADSLDH
ncbi:hypothetical protein [Arcticibacter tournemirensis]